MRLQETSLFGSENATFYFDFLGYVLDGEILYRQDKAREKRIKEAGFLYPKYLKDFDLSFLQGHKQKTVQAVSRTCMDRRNI